MLPRLAELACPACQRPMTDLRCERCGTVHPELGSLPVLYPDPAHALADWRNRWRLERQHLQRASVRAAQAAAAATSKTARTRLEQLAAAHQTHREAIELILAPMLHNDRGAARETLLGLRTRLPSHHAPASYNAHIARDWVWGRHEVEADLSRIRPLLQGINGPVLLPGCGTGRLAFELSGEHAVVALDSNPLLALLLADLAQGKERRCVEFPVAPITATDVAVTHSIRAPLPAQNLQIVLADLLNPPFKPGSFAAVVTHWLIDVIDCPFPQLVPTINRLLPAGGPWVNSGSLAFASAEPTSNLILDEIGEALEAGGFSLTALSEEDTPYLQSPHSRQKRTERVVTWKAEKVRNVAWQPWSHAPEWLANTKVPVPLFPAFQSQAATVRIHAWLMGMIDGKRSVDDIATELDRQGLMPKAEAEAAVRQFLRVMHEEMQRSG